MGSNETSSWVRGRNCVYRDSTVADYRVSIKTQLVWKSYGHFSDLETAAYVANIAILAERCEEKYELNQGIGEKNREELDRWRQQPGNLDLEKTAAERYKKVQSDIAALREQERIAAEQSALKVRRRHEDSDDAYQKRVASDELERIREHERRVTEIRSLSGPNLVIFIKTTDPYDPFHKIAVEEARRRLKNAPPSAT